jgi:aspartate kinase
VARIVVKFGGTSVANVERIRQAARHVKREVDAGNEVAVVVSAMSGKTNELVGWVNEASLEYDDAREYDAVVASGEQVTAGLMAVVLQQMGIPSRSYSGWQVPIHTDDDHGAARIAEIDPANLDRDFKAGLVPVITGFQGIHKETQRISTLGRGGSDTSAVAVAAAVKADRCDIYTDVDGVYTTDPRIVPKARRMNRVAFEEMLEMASLGAKVLMIRSVEMAMAHKVRLVVRSTFDDPEAPQIAPDGTPGVPGTLVCDEDEIMEKQIVSGVTLAKARPRSRCAVKDKPGVAAAIFGALADESIVVDMIVQNISEDGSTTDITFTVPDGEYDKSLKALKVAGEAHKIEYSKIEGAKGGAKVSVVGVGMRNHAGVAASMFKALADKGINIQLITTSEIKTSVLIDDEYAELAVRALHTYYGLDKEDA